MGCPSVPLCVKSRVKCTAARPLTSRNSRRGRHLRDGRQNQAFRHSRRPAHCTAGTAPLHISFRKAPPPVPPRGGGALKKAEGCCPDNHSIAAYVLFIRGAPSAVCHVLLRGLPVWLPEAAKAGFIDGCHEEVCRWRIKVCAGDNKARNCLL